MKARAFTLKVGSPTGAQEDALTELYEGLISRAAGTAGKAMEALTAAADWQPPPEGTILDSAALAAKASARARFLHEKALERVAAGVLEDLGIDWDVKHPLAKALLAKAGRRTGERLGEHVQGTLRVTLERAYADGLSVRDTAKLVRQEIRDAAPWQARMLAQTDLNGLSNGGSVMAATLAGVQYKTWLATSDARTRDDHADTDGQTVPVDQPFDVGGEQADYPGDPSLSDAQAANCRCTVIYSDSLSGPEPIIAEGGVMEDLTAAAKPRKWEGVLVREGVRFEDGRLVRKGATTWRQPPLSLMGLTVTDEGHKGAVLAGRIDEIWRDGDLIRGRGVFNNTPAGQEIAAGVEDESLRGISVDFAVQELSVQIAEEESLGEDGTVTLKPAHMDFVEAVIGMATVCPFQANEDALIQLVASAALHELGIDEDLDADGMEACLNSSDFLTAAAIGDLGKIETVVTEAEFSLPDETLSDRLDAAWKNLAATAELSARADAAEQRADDLEQTIDRLRAEYEADLVRVTQEQQLRALEQIEKLTAQLSKPRRVKLERDAEGSLHAVATQD